MSTFFGVMFVLVLMALPVLAVIWVVRAVTKKPVKILKKVIGICALSLIPLLVLGVVLDPGTWCEHEYTVVEDVAPTCTEKGRVVKLCALCERNTVEYIDETGHSWKMDSVVSATCTDEGHTLEKCEKCSVTRETNPVDALGHAMKEVSRREPTLTLEGEVLSRCERCGYDETAVLPKLNASEDSVVGEVGDTDWKTVFRANGFTESEISKYEGMLNNVGITDYHDVEVIENGAMHIIRGKIFDSNILQVNVTMENREIFLIELAGIPAEKTEAYINWRGKIKFKTVQSKKSVDLYYDAEGGYIAKLDWDNKMVSPYEE